MKTHFLINCILVSLILSFASPAMYAQEPDESHVCEFLVQVPKNMSNVEANECWNEDFFRLLEQYPATVIDVMSKLDYKVKSRILEHLRNPIHDGIDVAKIYQDIRMVRPRAQYVVYTAFDALGENAVSRMLMKKHKMRKVSYVSPDYEKMQYSDKTRKGTRKDYTDLLRVMDQLAYEGILDPQNDDITVYAGKSYMSGEIGDFIVKCNKGLYIAYVNKEICTPFRKIGTTDNFVEEFRPESFFGSAYVKNQRKVLATFFSGDMNESISLIRSLARPVNAELYMEYLWKIEIEDGKVTSDEMVAFEPLMF